MFRLVSAVVLTGAAADSILDGALSWIKNNGNEVLDTTQHCIAAAKLATDLHGKCGDAFNPQGWAAYSAWGLLQFLENSDHPMAVQLMNSSWVQSAKDQTVKVWRAGLEGKFASIVGWGSFADEAIQAMNHQTFDKFCSQPECKSNMDQIGKEYGTCYGGTLCASLSSSFDYAKCKEAMEEFLPKSMLLQEHGACASDGDLYCAELSYGIMLENPKCYARFMVPGTPGVTDSHACPSDCIDLWKQKQAAHSTCMTIVESQMKESYGISQQLSKRLIQASNDERVRQSAEHLPTTMSTFADVCIRGHQAMVV